MKEKLRSYEFWVSVFSAVLVVLQTLSTQINIPHMTEVMTAFLGALCVVGILKKTPSSGIEDKSEANQEKFDSKEKFDGDGQEMIDGDKKSDTQDDENK